MVSPELLRRYPFFAHFAPEQLSAIAMLAEEVTFQAGEMLFETGQPADALFLLIEGGVDLHYVVIDEINTELKKDFFISEINPGEPFGISALIEPFIYTGTVTASGAGRAVKIEATGLRALCETDPKVAAILMRQTAKTAMSRLNDTRVQLAAART